MKVLVPFGTRPEIIKLAPVVRALVEAGLSVRTVATGQHYDEMLTDAFYEGLRLRPDTRWSLSGSEGERLGAMLGLAYAEIEATRPDLVLCLGDTYTVPSFCLAARRHRVPIAHLEAGLRSFNPTSMEEVNRKVAAATAALHLAPTDLAARFLAAEGITGGRVRVVGNPVIDVLRAMGVAPVPPEQRHRVVVTAHRATNVDDPVRLEALIHLVVSLADEVGPVVFPVHPRTAARLGSRGWTHKLDRPGVTLCAPLAYDEMLDLLGTARVVVTDSGGLQEEASWLRIPVVVLRRSTPRWEGVEAGTSVLTGMDPSRALAVTKRLASPAEQARVAAVRCPYGDGHTSERVAALLSDPATEALLRIDEPDFVGRPLPW
jgi:UDP-N-acetylglucosamine 2-epimerase (non-hydrolysing)